jgi:hypothetical protein
MHRDIEQTSGRRRGLRMDEAIDETRAHLASHRTCEVTGCGRLAVRVERRSSRGGTAMRSVCSTHAAQPPTSTNATTATAEPKPGRSSRRSDDEATMPPGMPPDHMARRR